MAEAFLALYLGSQITADALVAGLKFLVNLAERVDTAFTHAKTRTRRLSEAAVYARNFIELFEGTVDELKTVFDGPRRPLLEAPLKKLKAAVAEAEALMRDLESYSNARWFARGNTYREKITKATEYLDSACQQLAQVLTGANAEVSLGIRQRVEQLVNDPQHQQFACVTIQQIREQEKEQQETVVEAGALSKEEFAELVSIVNEEHVRFTDRVAVLVQKMSSEARSAVNDLHNANEKYQASSLLVTVMRNKLEIHGEVRDRAHQLQGAAWDALTGGIRKAFAMIDTVQGSGKAADRANQIPKANAMINPPFGEFREAFRLLEEACKRLATDKPGLTVAVNATRSELRGLEHSFSGTVDAVLAAYARDPHADKTPLSDYFSAMLGKLCRELGEVLRIERQQLVIDAHRFLHTTDFEGQFAGPQQQQQQQQLSADDEPNTGKTEMESETLEYPDVLSSSQNQLRDLVNRAKQHAASFFERKGGRLDFKAEPIKHEHIHALLLDLEMLDVFVRGLQMKATAQLEARVLDSIRGLADMFGSLPRSVATPGPGLDFSGLKEQLDAIQRANEMILIQTGPVVSTSRPSSRRPSAFDM